MRLCRAYRLRHSEFLSWSDDDQDKAIAALAYEFERDAARCPSCHTARADWVDEDGRDLAVPAWAARVSTCPGCARVAAAQDLIPDDERAWKRVVLEPASGDLPDGD